MRDITKEWLISASIDLETIEQIIQNERLTGQVAFHAQQSIEKTLKAVLEENDRKVPKIHSLSKLFSLCAEFVSINLDEEIIIALDSLYIESRYPGELGLLPEGKPNIDQARKFYDSALFIYHSLKNQLESGK